MKTKSKVKSKRGETVIEGQWRATARYGGSGIAFDFVRKDARHDRRVPEVRTPLPRRQEAGVEAAPSPLVHNEEAVS